MSKSNSEYINNYIRENYDCISLQVRPKGLKEKIKKEAANNGESVNSYINNAIQKRMNGEFMPDNIEPLSVKRVPLLGTIPCGEPVFSEMGSDTYVECASNINADFCLVARGDSMVDARIMNGDLVFVKQQEEVENGEIAVVVINDETEATLKRFYKYPELGAVILRSENKAYPEMVFKKGDNLRVLGKAVAFQSLIK